MRTSVALLCSVLATVQLAGVPAARAINLGQVDTFESGTTLGWQVGSGGHPAPPTLATGGPAGSTDHFLQLEALGGDGPGSRLAVFNSAQWAGDYSAAGVTRIEMDVFNFGLSDLSLRLLFVDFEAMNPVNMALSADAMFVPAGSGWIRISFPTAAAALFAQSGSAGSALANADQLRLFHNPEMAYPAPPVGPPPVTVVVGVDNISAVPEPANPALFGAGLLTLLGAALLRRRSRRSPSDSLAA